MMIAWKRNRSIARRFVDYPIIEVLRECRRAIGLDVPKREADTRSSKQRVLFIDDDADTRELVWHVLTRENYEVQLAENAEQGALLAKSNSFDLYLIDNWMPGTSGVDLCAKLRKFDTQTPILFFSGAAYEQDKREAMAAGAQGYITKPANIDELLGEVSRLI
jgi:DNA-binding response OmpR family regulator